MHEQYALPGTTLEALETFLDSEANAHGLDFMGAHGFLTALTVGPRGTLDDDALAAFFEDEQPLPDAPASDALREQLRAWQKSIHAVLYHGSRLELPCTLTAHPTEPNELSDWCVGFMEGMFMEEDNWYEGDEDLIADLTPDGFADMFAQTITYGLFTAHASRSISIVPSTLLDLSAWYECTPATGQVCLGGVKSENDGA